MQHYFSLLPLDHIASKFLKSFHVNMTYSDSVVLEKKSFKWSHPIFALLWLSPLCRGPGPLFEQFRIHVTERWFVSSLIEIVLLVLEKKIFSIKTYVNMVFPIVGPSWPLGTMMWTILNLHYIRKLSCIYDLFWLSGFGEEDF
jgi:hypothetical protein